MWIIANDLMVDFTDFNVIFAPIINDEHTKYVKLYRRQYNDCVRINFKKITGNKFVEYMGGLLSNTLPNSLVINDELEDLIIGQFKTLDEFNDKK